mmetsp:Transcript_3769/g.7659  ORF Transcript_3769/g.7659 Transcript_3769/m.7659 type:complete len:468 (-) Transcript_3769:55-1458(-)
MSMRYVREESKEDRGKVDHTAGRPWSGRGARSHGRGSGRGRGRYVATGRCRGSAGRGRFSNSYSYSRTEADSSSKKWVRAVQEVSDVDPQTRGTRGEPSLAGVKGSDEDSSLKKNKDLASQSMERRGVHKLVKKPSDCAQGAKPALDSAGEDGDELLRKGRHKLVRTMESSYKRGRTSEVEMNLKGKLPSIETSCEARGISSANAPKKRDLDKMEPETKGFIKKQKKESSTSIAGMERRGFGKLVLRHNADDDNDPKASNARSAEVDSWTKRHSSHNKKRREASGPRRIALRGVGSAKIESDSEVVGDEDQHKKPEKSLTDHCYKDTGRGIRGRGRGRGRGRSAGRNGGRSGNIGLVRVQSSNPSETPICPTFRKGLPCNDPKCIYRHDVCSEASRPICVFFQRNGMCDKGEDCPFRHVKVNWNAAICPSFAQFGYCEIAGCALRHVVEKKKNSFCRKVGQVTNQKG